MRKLDTLRANRSGQLLIVAALAIALLISSTTIYVYELSKETSDTESSTLNDFILSITQSTRNTMVSSLANASNGGDKAVLPQNLNRFSSAIRSLNQFGVCNLTFSLFDDSVYDSGIWLSWNASSVAVSSVYADFSLDVASFASEATAQYSVNVTTSLIGNCSYALEGVNKHVSLIFTLYNDGEPALAKNVALFYGSSGNWTQISGSTVNYGNGTYFISLDVPSGAIQIFASVCDLREVFVQAKYDLL